MENMLKITSDFEDGDFIPTEYTCQGNGSNPHLCIANIPEGTESVAVIMDDPDAPMGTFVHWVAWNLPVGDIMASSSGGGDYSEGVNSASKYHYVGPCPPVGHGVHHYSFRVYALDTDLDIPGKADKETLLSSMDGHILSYGEIVGLFERN